VAAPGGWRRRIAGLAVSAATVAVASLAWPLAVELIPAASRPYIGGSTSNSVFDLILGYDGLVRIFGGVGNGGGGGMIGGGGGGGMFGGTAGILRLFNAEFGTQVSWLIPYALIALASGLWLRLRAGRTDRRLVGYLLWGGWLGVHALVFSFMSGVIHPYYSVILAPAVGALVGAGTVELWRWRSRSPIGGLVLAGAFVASGVWAWALLERTPDFAPGLGIAVFGITVAAGVVVALPAALLPASRRWLSSAAVVVALAALLAGPAVYAADTMATAYSGGNPTAGPSSGSGGGFAAGGAGGPTAFSPGATTDGMPPGSGTAPPGGATASGGTDGAMGGWSADTALTAYLVENAGSARWIVAVSGSGTAAGIQLATGLPVMTMGGFNGGDAAPTLEQLKASVASGELRYVLLGSGGGGGAPGGASTSDRDAWVTSACTAVDTGSSSGTLYDCADAVGG
jgi:hypothetical protein